MAATDTRVKFKCQLLFGDEYMQGNLDRVHVASKV